MSVCGILWDTISISHSDTMLHVNSVWEEASSNKMLSNFQGYHSEWKMICIHCFDGDLEVVNKSCWITS